MSDFPSSPAARRRIFGDIEVPTDATVIPASAVPAHTQLDQIRSAQPRRKEAKRNRNWERAHPGATYRKVPQEVRLAVLNVSEETGYTASQIAQAFLEYALAGFHRGDFALEPELGPRGTSLFQGGGWEADTRPIWAEGIGQPPDRKSRGKKRADPKLTKSYVSYRLSPAVAEGIEGLCA